MLVLRKLTTADAEAFGAAYCATETTDPTFARGFAKERGYLDYLAHLEAAELGLNLAEGHVASTTYWGFVGDALVGRLSLRHRLNEALLRSGGNIGYVVVPAYRRRGIATEMLKLALPLAREREPELARVLLTCDDDNVPSQRVIEACGGVLEDVTGDPETGVRRRRYWIRVR